MTPRKTPVFIETLESRTLLSAVVQGPFSLHPIPFTAPVVPTSGAPIIAPACTSGSAAGLPNHDNVPPVSNPEGSGGSEIINSGVLTVGGSLSGTGEVGTLTMLGGNLPITVNQLPTNNTFAGSITVGVTSQLSYIAGLGTLVLGTGGLNLLNGGNTGGTPTGLVLLGNSGTGLQFSNTPVITVGDLGSIPPLGDGSSPILLINGNLNGIGTLTLTQPEPLSDIPDMGANTQAVIDFLSEHPQITLVINGQSYSASASAQ